MTTTASCPSCGASLDEVPPDQPCPVCGGTGRHVAVFLHDTATVTDAMPTIEIAYNTEPGWTQQWTAVQHHLQRLREQYHVPHTAGGNQVMGETVLALMLALMLALWHLKDWLADDDELPPKLTQLLNSGLFYRRIRDAYPALVVCGGYANTAKHRNRRLPGELIARNATFTSSGPAMTIACWRSTDDPAAERRTVDALDLAEQCVHAWTELLTEYGIPIPEP